MIAAIHQPQYLPWLGYFDKMARADVFVLLDNVQFKKNEWQNRNRIRTPGDPGWQWLTVPVLHDHGQLINEVRLNGRIDWRSSHQKTLELNYTKSPFFTEYWPRLQTIYRREWPDLAALNIDLIRTLVELLGIRTKITVASGLPVTTSKTQRLIDICRAVGCDTYLAGAGCAEYMDFDLFKASGIGVQIQEYRHPKYPQLWGHGEEDFIPYLSTLDLLFNAGSGALAVLRGE
jgi:hypothetical protein